MLDRNNYAFSNFSDNFQLFLVVDPSNGIDNDLFECLLQKHCFFQFSTPQDKHYNIIKIFTLESSQFGMTLTQHSRMVHLS